ncbi:hypothetical protein B566_EDAN007448 [Ephemera danica]|nr:hypothetical protein B566_EDAN007448 [Ephemera danica]
MDDRHRMVLEIADARPERIKSAEQRLITELESLTGLVIGVERVSPRIFLAENKSLVLDQAATDVWFYAADPDTGAVLERNSTRVQRSIMDKNATDSIKVAVSGTLHATASAIHPPLSQPNKEVRTAAAPASLDVFPIAIIIIACIVLVLGVVGIIYICISWSRYRTYKERMQRMYVVPRYDPVLQMSVPLDDSDSYNDLQLDLDAHKNHAFSQQSPASSEAATTVRASEAGGTLPGRAMRHGGNGQILDPSNMPVTNPIYQRSLDSDSHVNPSSTNENVTFREKKDFSHMGFSYLGDRSPVETTTEL